MGKQWKMVRIEAGLHEDIGVEIARLVEAYESGAPVAVPMTESNKPGHAGITVSDFVRRLLTVYQRARRRKEKSAVRKRAAKKGGAS